MRTGTAGARALIVCAIAAAAAPKAGAQAPCSSSTSLADSARADLVAVMSSGSPLVAELRTEQRIAPNENGDNAVIVKDPAACTRIVSAFTHRVPSGTSVTVLRMGSLYYARDPDQRQATGVITDSTFKVLMRLGRAVDEHP
jgi:hypothetical protein